jgi:membrane associated rhomboid family serine protease
MRRDITESGAGDTARRVPVATAVVLALTAAATGLQLVFPPVLAALRRDPAALAAGEWWRMVTPLFVHSDGWAQIVVNLLGIAVIGPTVERIYGSGRWLLLYFGAGILDEAISYAWQPYGAGASIALCGLIAGLLAWQVARRHLAGALPSLYALCFIAGLAGLAIGGFVADIVLTVVAGSTLGTLIRRNSSETAIVRFVGGASLLGAVVLAALRDNHGTALLIGALIAAALLWRMRAASRSFPEAGAA